MAPRRLCPLSSTAAQQQELLRNGKITSVALVLRCLMQIDTHNRAGAQLRTLITVAPLDLITARAAQLDLERSNGRIRSSLHGIPVVVSVCMSFVSTFVNLLTRR